MASVFSLVNSTHQCQLICIMLYKDQNLQVFLSALQVKYQLLHLFFKVLFNMTSPYMPLLHDRQSESSSQNIWAHIPALSFTKLCHLHRPLTSVHLWFLLSKMEIKTVPILCGCYTEEMS